MSSDSRPSILRPQSDALSYESALPLLWTPLAALPDSATLERYHEDNLRVLADVALLDEQRSGGGEDGGVPDGDLARLHQKMNLLVDLVSFLVSQQAPAVPPQPVRLSWKGIGWRGEGGHGDGLVSLRLHRSVPHPFLWPARIVHAEAGELYARFEPMSEACQAALYARFEPMSEACQAALERHVFLHHRRAIGGGRRPASAG